MHEIIESLYEDQQFFYHSNHLGSTSWITDAGGNADQHLQYLPFGELLVDQRPAGNDIRFKFTGKERDSETGFDYFGARYYASDLSIWLSVDPLSDMYPSTSPYMYVRGNPIMLIDPNGMNDTKYEDSNGNLLAETNDGNTATVVISDENKATFQQEYKIAKQMGAQNIKSLNKKWTGMGKTKQVNSESWIDDLQEWFYGKFGIEVSGSGESNDYSTISSSDRKVDVTKKPLNPKRVGLGDDNSNKNNSKKGKSSNTPPSITQWVSIDFIKRDSDSSGIYTATYEDGTTKTLRYYYTKKNYEAIEIK